jgi:hypothetical protein
VPKRYNAAAYGPFDASLSHSVSVKPKPAEKLLRWVFQSESDAKQFYDGYIDWMFKADYHYDVRRVKQDGDTVSFDFLYLKLKDAEEKNASLERVAAHYPAWPKPVRVLMPEFPRPPASTGASTQQIDVLNQAVTKRPASTLSQAIAALQKGRALDADELKAVRHELYKRGMKKEADLFRVQESTLATLCSDLRSLLG